MVSLIPQTGKPGRGAVIDWSNPLSQGLVHYYPLNEGAGNVAYDLCRNLNLSAAGFGSNPVWSGGPKGSAIACVYQGAGFVAALPAAQQISWPITIAWGFRLGTSYPDQYSGTFGIIINTTNASPYFVTSALPTTGTGTVVYAYDQSGHEQNTGTMNWALGADHVCSFSVKDGSQVGYFDGQQIVSVTASGIGTPTYGSGASLAIGNFSGINRNSHTLYYWAAVWNRILDPSEHSALYSNPWQIVRSQSLWPAVYSSLSSLLFRRTLYDRAGSRGVA